MPRGGARPNTGPKPGPSRGETIKLIQQAADDGVLPLKIMFDSLRFYTKQFDGLIAKIMDGRIDPIVAQDGSTPEHPEPNADVVDALKQVMGVRKRAEEVAVMAAPYCHPRQGVVAEEERADDFVPLSERIAKYQRDADVALAENKVVDFPGK